MRPKSLWLMVVCAAALVAGCKDDAETAAATTPAADTATPPEPDVPVAEDVSQPEDVPDAGEDVDPPMDVPTPPDVEEDVVEPPPDVPDVSDDPVDPPPEDVVEDVADVEAPPDVPDVAAPPDAGPDVPPLKPNVAFPGAPPTMPHEPYGCQLNCLGCHGDPPLAAAPASPHPERKMCTQCHLPQEDVPPWVDNTFAP